MVSLRRRQVIIAGLGTVVAPAAISALPSEPPQKLVLSGRVLGPDSKPLAGAAVAVGSDRAATDADGRFALVTTTRRNTPALYHVTCNGRTAEGFVSDQQRDTHGTWRASFGLTLA